MPTYPYECQACRAEWDEEQSIRAPATEHCPTCGGPAKRVIKPGAVIAFLGEGWTKTWSPTQNRKTPQC